MGSYTKIMPQRPKEDLKNIVKVLDDIRRALKEVYKKLDDLEDNKADA